MPVSGLMSRGPKPSSWDVGVWAERRAPLKAKATEREMMSRRRNRVKDLDVGNVLKVARSRSILCRRYTDPADIYSGDDGEKDFCLAAFFVSAAGFRSDRSANAECP